VSTCNHPHCYITTTHKPQSPNAFFQCFLPAPGANSVIEAGTGKSYEYCHLITGTVQGHTSKVWSESFANELGRLTNGVSIHITKGTNTIIFIRQDRSPLATKLPGHTKKKHITPV
jgi:hypothetical protein